MQYNLVCPCHFGLEAVLKREIADLGLEITRVEDGRVFFRGDESAVARANMFLRTTERVLMVVGEFTATTYDELFENTKALDWSELMPQDANFYITKASSVKSKLFSPSDIQRIMGKAVVESMKRKYHLDYFPKSGAEYPIRTTINRDLVTVTIDTSGESLHKRGYRKMVAKAPISETLAAAIIMLTPWKRDRLLVDPFCGSGTFPIEAALMGANIAPGIARSFAGEKLAFIPKATWPVIYVSWQFTLKDGTNFSYNKTFETYVDSWDGKEGRDIRIGNANTPDGATLDAIWVIACDDLDLEMKGQYEANHLDIGYANVK